MMANATHGDALLSGLGGLRFWHLLKTKEAFRLDGFRTTRGQNPSKSGRRCWAASSGPSAFDLAYLSGRWVALAVPR